MCNSWVATEELGAWIPVTVMQFSNAMYPAANALSLMFKMQANVSRKNGQTMQVK